MTGLHALFSALLAAAVLAPAFAAKAPAGQQAILVPYMTTATISTFGLPACDLPTANGRVLWSVCSPIGSQRRQIAPEGRRCATRTDSSALYVLCFQTRLKFPS
jgi:hypothetical protein